MTNIQRRIDSDSSQAIRNQLFSSFKKESVLDDDRGHGVAARDVPGIILVGRALGPTVAPHMFPASPPWSVDEHSGVGGRS
jgi:hypothetical protein